VLLQALTISFFKRHFSIFSCGSRTPRGLPSRWDAWRRLVTLIHMWRQLVALNFETWQRGYRGKLGILVVIQSTQPVDFLYTFFLYVHVYMCIFVYAYVYMYIYVNMYMYVFGGHLGNRTHFFSLSSPDSKSHGWGFKLVSLLCFWNRRRNLDLSN